MGFLGPIIARLLATRIGASVAANAPKILAGARDLLNIKGGKEAQQVVNASRPAATKAKAPPGRVHPSSPRATRANLVSRVTSYLRPNALPQAQAAGTTAPQANFSALANKGANFGNVLSGKVTAQQVVQQNQAQNPTVAGAASSLGSGAAKGAATAGLLGAFVGITLAGKKLAEMLVEGQRSLVRFNGQIAVAYAQLERGDLLRQQASGGRTAGTTETLVGAVNDMKNELQPLKDLGTNILNVIGTGFAKLVAGIVAAAKWLPGIAGVLKAMDDEAKRNRKNAVAPWMNTINGLADQYRADHNPARRGRHANR